MMTMECGGRMSFNASARLSILTALRLDGALPAAVLGPVDLAALRRLVSARCSGVSMFFVPLSLFGCWKWKGPWAGCIAGKGPLAPSFLTGVGGVTIPGFL